MVHSAKRSIVKKTIEIGASTFLSRMLALAREIFQARLLGVGIISDAFIAAYKFPNFLRKIFAEGALTGAFVPTIVSIVKRDGKKSASDLMTLSFIVFEGILFFICLLVLWKPYWALKIMVWGFSEDQIAYAIPFLRILILFILFVSSSALLTGALQAVHHFLIPALSSVVLNIFYLAGLLGCLWYGWSLNVLCMFIVAGSAVSFLLHVFVYFKYHFTIGTVTPQAWYSFRHLIKKFIPSLFGMSIEEINMFIGSTIASFLPKGSYTLIYYGARFMGIPLGVFAVAFSSILLPHFTRVGMYAPRRLSFYLLEASKLVLWVTIPATLLMSMIGDKIYLTLFVSDKFPITRVPEATSIFIAYMLGLFFYSLNKILLNLYYSMHDTRVPMVTSMISVAVDISMSLTLVGFFQGTGIALANTIAGMAQTIVLLYALHRRHNFTLYTQYFLEFAWRYVVQLALVIPLFYGIYRGVSAGLFAVVQPGTALFLTDKIGLWFWLIPLLAGVFAVLYVTRKTFGLRLHFLD